MATRSAATASAFSRHPDLAEAPVLDIALEASEGADADELLSQRQKRTAAATAVFVPLAVTPAVERMLQVRLLHSSDSSDLLPPPPHSPAPPRHTPLLAALWLVAQRLQRLLAHCAPGMPLCVCLQCCAFILRGLTRVFGSMQAC